MTIPVITVLLLLVLLLSILVRTNSYSFGGLGGAMFGVLGGLGFIRV